MGTEPVTFDRPDEDRSALVRAVVITDLVDSTALMYRLGDSKANHLFRLLDALLRKVIASHHGTEVDKSDGFLLIFERPIHAVRFAMDYHAALRSFSLDNRVEIMARVGIHLGEIIVAPTPPGDVKRGAKRLEVEGLSKVIAARLSALSIAGQTLISRPTFDLARRALVGEPMNGTELKWLAHGPYHFKGIDEPLEVFEVGINGLAPLVAPPDSEKGFRIRVSGDEQVLGWRPAPGEAVPGRREWILVQKLGKGGYGEVWLTRNPFTGERRVFKFCFEPDRVKGLKREAALLRVLRENLGDRDDISPLLGWNLNEPPYYLESGYSEGGNLREWSEQKGGIGAIGFVDRLEIVAKVADALAAAHSVKVLHKDVKPSNVLIEEVETDEGPGLRVRLADFGVGLLTDRAKLANLTTTLFGTGSQQNSGDSSHSGTHLYMAPELLEGKEASEASDIYALGVMLYQVVCGDLAKAFGSGWEVNVRERIIREYIRFYTDGDPARRERNASVVAAQLRGWMRRSADESRRQIIADGTSLVLGLAISLGMSTLAVILVMFKGSEAAMPALVVHWTGLALSAPFHFKRLIVRVRLLLPPRFLPDEVAENRATRIVLILLALGTVVPLALDYRGMITKRVLRKLIEAEARFRDLDVAVEDFFSSEFYGTLGVNVVLASLCTTSMWWAGGSINSEQFVVALALGCAVAALLHGGIGIAAAVVRVASPQSFSDRSVYLPGLLAVALYPLVFLVAMILLSVLAT